MKRIITLIFLIVVFAPPAGALGQFVFWFDHTTTLYLTNNTTTISTINATYGTIIDETSYITQTTNKTLITNILTIYQKILIGNTTITKERYFFLVYESVPRSYSKVVQKIYENYPETTFTRITSIDIVTLTDKIIGRQTISRTIIISNTETSTTFKQQFDGGIIYYTASSNIEYFRSLTISMKSPLPIFGSVIIWSNPYTTTIQGYLNAIISNKQIYYNVTGTNTFTAVIAVDTITFTLIGDGIRYTEVFSDYSVEYCAIPTIRAGNGHYTLFQSPPFILYLNGNYPIIIIPENVKTTSLKTMNILSYKQALYVKISTITSKNVVLPRNVPGFSLDASRATTKNDTLYVYGTLYYNESAKNTPANILFPNVYNAQNIYSLVKSIDTYAHSLDTVVIETLVINMNKKILTLNKTPTQFLISVGNYGTIQKVTITLIDKNTPTKIYEYTYADNTIAESFFTNSMTIIYETTMLAPMGSQTVYSKSAEIITFTVTITTNETSGTFIVQTTTEFLKTTIIKPTRFSAIKSEIETDNNTTKIIVYYTSPEKTVEILSITYTVVMKLVYLPTTTRIVPVTASNSSPAGFVLTTSAPEDVKKATGKTLSVIFYIILAVLFIHLLISALCFVRADDDDERKHCLIRILLTITAIIIIIVMPIALDWVVGL